VRTEGKQKERKKAAQNKGGGNEGEMAKQPFARERQKLRRARGACKRALSKKDAKGDGDASRRKGQKKISGGSPRIADKHFKPFWDPRPAEPQRTMKGGTPNASICLSRASRVPRDYSVEPARGAHTVGGGEKVEDRYRSAQPRNSVILRCRNTMARKGIVLSAHKKRRKKKKKSPPCHPRRSRASDLHSTKNPPSEKKSPQHPRHRIRDDSHRMKAVWSLDQNAEPNTH